jgi:hypothetical protein
MRTKASSSLAGLAAFADFEPRPGKPRSFATRIFCPEEIGGDLIEALANISNVRMIHAIP